MGVREIMENAARLVLGTQLSEQATAIQQRDDSLDLLSERLAELELALEDEGWSRLSGETDSEFSREGRRRIGKLARLYWLKNPLIKRAVAIQTQYVFGQGLNISARDPDVAEVVKAFIDDKKNLAELTGHQARMAKEVELQVAANVFFVLFTHPATGHVRLGSIPECEIDDVISNPGNAKEPWYYKRVRVKRWFDLERGEYGTKEETTYHPDWQYKPAGGYPQTIGGKAVEWDAPVYHVAVNRLSDMKFGVSEIYAAIDWAKAHKEMLGDWATIVRAHARFAWHYKPGGGRGAAATAKTRLGTTRTATDGTETNPPPAAGSTLITNGDFAPIKTAGSTASPEDSRQLKLMVAAATGISEHYFGDPSTGNLATSTSMERPMELMFLDRQTLWRDVFQAILNYAIDAAALAPGGKLAGVQRVNEYGERWVDTGELDRHVDVDFPPLLEKSIKDSIAAIISAGTLDGKSPAGLDLKTITRMLLVALGEDDVDAMIEDLFPEGWEEERAAKAMAMQQVMKPAAGERPDDDDPDDDPRAAKIGKQATEAARDLLEAIRGLAADAA